MTFRRTYLIIAFISLPFALLGCKENEQENKAPPLRFVNTLTVTNNANTEWREFPGAVDAVQKANLSFRISGKLNELKAKEGDNVQQGQLLAKLDTKDISIELNKAKAEYAQIHADFERGESLVTQGVISRSDFDKLKAQNAAAEAALESARQNLSYAHLRAPFNGQIAKRLVDNYEDVSAMESIYVLQDLSSVNIKVDVPENVIIRIGEQNIPDVYAIFDIIPNERFPLELKEIATQPDDQTNTYEVTFTMDSIPGYNLLPGMSVTVRGERNQASENEEAAYFIPANTVVNTHGDTYVFIVKPSDDNTGIVKKRSVTTGALTGQGVQVLSGLNDGDTLITAGMSKMQDGMKVKLGKSAL